MAQEMKRNSLLEDFAPVSTSQWYEKTVADLKGADFDKKLVWRPIEGFAIKPMHRAEDIEQSELPKAQAGQFPYLRGNSAQDNTWEIRQDIVVQHAQAANQKALDALCRGANAIGFDVTQAEVDMAVLLKHIDPVAASIHFRSCERSLAVMQQVASTLNQPKARGSVNFAPLSRLLARGNYYQTAEADFATAKELILFAEKALPEFRVIGIAGFLFHNAGASIVQEIAFALAKASEYLARLTDMGLTANQVAPRLQFNFGTGSNYFFEIAKYRAVRYLWANIAAAYGADAPNCKTYIHAQTSRWTQTIYDPYVNMLRNTTQAMSAVLGGANSLEVLPHDAAYQPSSEFSERIARNVQLVLKEESYFDKVVDPAAGSYYIETLTQQLIDASWAMFKQVEDLGGFVAAVEQQFIQQQVQETASKRDSNLANRRQILLGTNQYPNQGERVSDSVRMDLVRATPSPLPNPLVAPLKMYRGARAFEELRLRTEAAARTPRVFLLTYGNLAMRKARAMFATNFFACAGFEVVDNNGFETVAQGAEAALAAKADLVVLCSADEEYLAMAQTALQLLGSKALVVVAGNPAEADAIRAVGVNDFIHVRTNVLQSLTDFQQRLLN